MAPRQVTVVVTVQKIAECFLGYVPDVPHSPIVIGLVTVHLTFEYAACDFVRPSKFLNTMPSCHVVAAHRQVQPDESRVVLPDFTWRIHFLRDVRKLHEMSQQLGEHRDGLQAVFPRKQGVVFHEVP